MNIVIKKAALAVVLGFAANTVMGAGFALYEFSARGNAMGGAVMANRAEAASLAVNPALITQIEGSQVQTGATFVAPSATATVANESRDLKNDIFVLPNAYFTYQASENVFLGLAGFSRFGLGGEYGDYQMWLGSISAHKFDVVTFSVTPVISAKVTDDLSLSMGLEYMYIEFTDHKAFGPTYADIEASGGSWGGSFSAFYKPEWAPKFGFGAAYRTKIRQVLDGSVKSTMPIPSGDAIGSVTLPDSLNFGVSYEASDKLVLETGIVGTFWSSYDAIRIEYPDTGTGTGTGTGIGILVVEDKKYKDSIRVNIGAEYSLTNNWDIRGGYAFDESPTNRNYMDTLVPVGDRHLFNAGVGYKQNNWGVDFAYTYLLGKDMKGTGNIGGAVLPVEYTNGEAHMFAFTFKYSFPQRFLRSK